MDWNCNSQSNFNGYGTMARQVAPQRAFDSITIHTSFSMNLSAQRFTVKLITRERNDITQPASDFHFTVSSEEVELKSRLSKRFKFSFWTPRRMLNRSRDIRPATIRRNIESICKTGLGFPFMLPSRQHTSYGLRHRDEILFVSRLGGADS